MTFKYTTVKHRCPKCNKIYEYYRKNSRPLDRKYGTPIVTCPNCNNVFLDKSRREIAVDGISIYDKQMFRKEDIIKYSLSAAVGLIFIFFLSNIDLSKIVGALLIIYAVLGTLNRLLSYKPKMKKLEELQMQSENRLNDKKYVKVLLQFGVDVPEKYLEKQNKNKPKECKNDSKSDSKMDALMTAQLVALYKTTHSKEYCDEYERRLEHIGFENKEAKSLFLLELMMLKHDHIQTLIDDNYLVNNYFNLKTPVFPMDYTYYVEHQTFLVSEITKIWDEAEYVWTYLKNQEMPDDVVNEIYKITRYGGGNLLVETLKSISEHSHIDFSKIQKYSVCEQDMMFKYKWNKNSNEKHPYH